MARRLIALAGSLALVAVLALVAYVAAHRGRRVVTRAGEEIPEDQAARRATELRLALGRAEQRLDAARIRVRVDSLLRRSGPEDTTSLAVLVEAEGSGGAPAVARLTAAVRGAWRDLGLGVTKVAVGVVLLDRAKAREWGRQLGAGAGEPTRFYFLPDSLAPSTCLVLVVAPIATGAEGELRSKSAEWFGPCAFYARFGIPAPRVRGWLDARAFDVSLAPDWAAGEGDRMIIVPWLTFASRVPEWYWRVLYLMPPDAAACFGGRGEACRRTVAEGDREFPAWHDGIVAQSDQSWNVTRQRLVGSEHFLGAILRATGPRRFQEFWRSPLPVDSALTLALRRPVGEWTAEWQGEMARRPRFGPGIRRGDLGLCILLIAGALAAALRSSCTREVV